MTIASLLIWVTNTLNNDGEIKPLTLRTKVNDLTLRDARQLRELARQIIDAVGE
tara:strand:+ start:309 stop:470 length:162 start_codon:yes stop_codon:yes gene_type:complete